MSRLGTSRPLRRVYIAAAVLGTAAMVGFGVPPEPVSAAPAGATPPATIPALRSWTPGTGSYHFTNASRVVVDPAFQAQLLTTASTLAGDVQQLLGHAPAVTIAAASAVRAGDVLLTITSADAGLGSEGYRLDIGSSVRVAGHTDAGVFYATRTLLQVLHGSRTIAAGTTRDLPAYPERGMMVDVGRKYYTVDWLRAHIKELAYLKLNYLHLHLSDNLGFRLESRSHPEIVSPQHYTKQDIRDLLALAARYHVTIVPEIDMPGHMDQILAAHPDLKLTSKSGMTNNGFLDLSKPGAYTLMRDLITEYLPLFSGPYWHIGADEYVSGGSGKGSYQDYPQLLAYARSHYGPNATAKDVFYGYVNWADTLIRQAGKTTRMWNDDLRGGDGTITPNADIVVEYWYHRGGTPPSLTPQQIVDGGHAVMNAHYTQTYYVLGGRKPDLVSMYETWTVNSFHGNYSLAPAANAHNLGAKLHVWGDRPTAETEQQVAAGIADSLRVLAQQTWNSPKAAATYADFADIIATVGHSPGWPYAASTPSPSTSAGALPAKASASTAGMLAMTGGDSAVVATVGLFLTAAGTVLVLASHRRPAAAPSAGSRAGGSSAPGDD